MLQEWHYAILPAPGQVIIHRFMKGLFKILCCLSIEGNDVTGVRDIAVKDPASSSYAAIPTQPLYFFIIMFPVLL